MSLTVQNLRAVGTGVEPASLLPGQIAFNITDKVMYVGDGSGFKTDYEGNQVPGVPGEGWYAMPMDFDSLGNYYVANPTVYGDIPTDQQVLTWSTALDHPIWTSGGGGGGNQVYVVTSAAVASATGATTSDKITAAIGVVSPDEGDVTIVTGLPNDVYEGLYFFTTLWIKGAAYAYPSAAEVIYNNTGRTLGATVQAAIDDLDDGLIATTAIANTANSTATSALSIASAALPRTGGTMTGVLNTVNVNVLAGSNIAFASGTNGNLTGITDSTSVTSSTVAASATAVKNAYDLAAGALSRTGGTMSGAITFAAGQVFPVSGIQDASTAQKGVVQIGANIDVVSGTISVKTATTTDLGLVRTGTNVQNTAGLISVLDASTSQKGVVQLNNTTASAATDQALTAAMGASLQTQINGITISGTTTLAGSIDASTGLLLSVTTQGAAAGFVINQPLPAPAPDPSPPGNNNYYVLVTVPGTFTPPGGSPITSENGDWILSDGVTWQELEVGARPAYATTSTAGVVVLADNAATQTGTDGTLAVTPLGLQSKVSDSVATTSSTTIASSTAVKTAYDIGAAAIPCSVITAVGNIVVGGTGAVPTALPVGSDNQILMANSACASGLEWVSDTPGDVTTVSGTSPITVDNTDPQNPVVEIDAASTTQPGAVQLDDTVTSTSVTEAATANAVKTAYDIGAAAIPCSSFSALGQILSGTGTGTFSALAAGTNGQFLAANSACGTGLQWCTLSLACIPCSAFTSSGDLLVGTGSSTYAALPIGATGQSLVVDLTCTATGGLKWGQSLVGYTCSLTPFNTALGVNAGDSVTTGDHNTLVGYNVGTTLASGSNNTALGSEAGASTVGSNNVLVGYCAGNALGVAGSNTFLGGISGFRATVTDGSVGVGYCTFAGVMTGDYNNALGFRAGEGVTSGTRNTFVGPLAGRSVTTGSNNVILGGFAGSASLADNVVLSTGGATPVIRFQANANGAWSPDGANFGTSGQVLASQGFAATPVWCTLSLACVPCAAFTAVGDILVGAGSATFSALPVGTNNQVLTADSACTATGGLKWSTPAALCGYTCGSTLFNTALGCQAGDSITTGTDNVSIGYNAGTAQAAGAQSVFIGSGAGQNANAGGVTAIGFCAGQALTTANCATYLGFVSGRNATGLNNTYVGALTGNAASNTSACGTFLGFCAGSAVTNGNGNTFLGFQAGRLVTTGGFNVAIGTATFQSATTGACNVAIGCGALNGGITGNGSTAVGTRALTNTTGTGVNTAVGSEAGAFTTGTGNAYFGVNAGCAVTTGNCNTLLGRNSGTAITTGSCNTIVGSFAGSTALANNVVLSDGAGTVRFQANATGAWSPDGTNYGTAGQVLQSNGNAAVPTWATPQTVSTTATKATTSGTPINLLSWTGSVRMGDLTVMATDNATNVAWGNVTIASDTGAGSSIVTTSGGTFGTFAVISGGGGETIVQFTPSATLATVNFVYKYTASFGAQPTVL